MFAAQIAAAVAAARTFPQFDATSRAVWAAHAAGLLDDVAAQAAAEALQTRKALITGARIEKRAHGLRRPSAPRSPDRAASIRRRRACAASGAVPAALAAAFTVAELAALSVVAGEVRRRGCCALPIDAIAAMAGTSRSVVKRALRHAAALGLVSIEERPQPGRKHLPNIVRVVSQEWRAWLRLGDRGPGKDRLVKQDQIIVEGCLPKAGIPLRSRSVPVRIQRWTKSSRSASGKQP